MLVELVYTLSGRGLTKDADLLKEVICSLGHKVSIKALPPQHPLVRELSAKWSRVKKRLPSRRAVELANSFQKTIRRLLSTKTCNADLVIHLENIHPHFLNPRCPNWLIPNQEWFRPERIHYLDEIKMVLCKTDTAKECFESYHHSVEYLGFSAPVAMHRNDWGLPEKNPNRILHVAGASPFKGTRAVLDAWKQNPQWPSLTLIANSSVIEGPLPTNIELKSNVTDEELQALWQEAAIAVIPSEVEGYGQVLAEAMSYGAVLVTTDAPPMNELVNNDRGYLVPYSETTRFRLGMRYKVGTENLELAINKAVDASDELRQTKAMNALSWAKANHEAFVRQLAHYLDSIPPSAKR